MYHGRPALRWLVYLGTLGVVALAPGRERHAPVWLVVGLAVLPIALLELGAMVAGDARSSRALGWGQRLQVAGACAYLSLLAAVLALATPRPRGAGFMIGLALFGVFASTLVLWDRMRLGRGSLPVAIDPAAAGERLASRAQPASPGRRLADGLAVVGGMPILVGFIGLVFVAVNGYVVLVDDGAPPPVLVIGIAFFGGVLLIAVAQGLERWETLVGTSRIRPLRALLQLLSMLAFGSSLAALGWQMHEDPQQPPAKAWLLIIGGGLCIAGGIIYAARSFSPSRNADFELVREGLLERAPRGWFVYSWAQLAAIALGEFHGMPALYVTLAADDGLEYAGDPKLGGDDRERRLERKRRSLRLSRRLFGADIMILPPMTGDAVGDLYRALHTALVDARAREALPTWRERWMATRMHVSVNRR